ncbi:hypothetical protein [Levilactobacillus spicheri]|uniref:DUF3383 family protein n=2 Tax=Levilactobacillus spicheri TaxID=216463 RepID=A0ABQ0WQC8_9LACO|nr:hypothetical protein [Levilactobacillus spicheri]KRL50431.1 hypothetical protein FD37_GL002097 [Levilactobacillus spicheri DSM 15429]GEO67307.1 hypothetical protein LSP04_17260 [Levilactobacillus spicheri]
MAITKIIKQPSDVIVNTIIKNPSLGADSAPIALLIHGTDTTESSQLCYDPDQMADFGFDENTEEYALVQAMFDVDGFQGPVQLGVVPNAPVVSLDDQIVTPTKDGATISAMVPGVQKWLEDHIYDGAKWFIPVGLTDDEIKAAAEVLYSNQRGFLVHTVDNMDDLRNWHDYAVANQNTKDHLGHFRVVIEKNHENKVAAQACAFASLNILIDWMRIGGKDLTQFTPDDWIQSERDEIDALNGLTVVDKAGDNMLSGSQELNGDYIDNSFNAQYNTDYLQFKAQKWLNGKKFAEFTDDNINELLTTIDSAAEDLFKIGTIGTTVDGKIDFNATAKTRAQVSQFEIMERKYKSISIEQGLPNPFEKVYIKNAITL